MYRLTTIQARTNPDDGVLKNIDGTEVALVANSPELDVAELVYHVTFTNVVYGGESDQEILSLSFVAPVDDTPIDLATVDRLPS